MIGTPLDYASVSEVDASTRARPRATELPQSVALLGQATVAFVVAVRLFRRLDQASSEHCTCNTPRRSDSHRSPRQTDEFGQTGSAGSLPALVMQGRRSNASRRLSPREASACCRHVPRCHSTDVLHRREGATMPRELPTPAEQSPDAVGDLMVIADLASAPLLAPLPMVSRPPRCRRDVAACCWCCVGGG